jgi:hypothetical protein
VTLRCQLLDLLRAVGLPVIDVRVVAYAQWAAGEDDGADVVVEASGADCLLVRLGSAGLLGQDEAGADPDSAGAQRHGGCQTLAVEEATGCDDLHFGAQAALLALAHGCHGGDQDSCGNIASVTTTLTALGADHVGAEGEALGNVLGVADHVHVEDAGLVEALDGGFGGDADGGDEEAGAGVDDDGHELVELALGVVVAVRCRVSIARLLVMAWDALHILSFPGTAANLRNQEIDTERSILVVEEALEFRDLFSEHVRSVTYATDHTNTTGIGDGCCELGTGSHVHAGEHDGVCDLEQVGGDRADLF